MAAGRKMTNKKPSFGKQVSHSHRRTSRRWDPNLQSIRVEIAPGTVRKVRVSASDIKAGKFKRPTPRVKP